MCIFHAVTYLLCIFHAITYLLLKVKFEVLALSSDMIKVSDVCVCAYHLENRIYHVFMAIVDLYENSGSIIFNDGFFKRTIS